MQHELHAELQAADERVRSLREDRNRLRKLFESAKAAASEHESETTMSAALAAKESLADVDGLLEQAQDDQVNLLGRLADMESGRAGFSFRGGSGWDKAASRLNLAEGRLRVDVAGGSLLKAQVGPLPPSPNSGVAGIQPGNAPSTPIASPRYLYPALVQLPIGDGVVATDYEIDFSGPGVTGAVSGVERAVDATTPKAELSPDVSLATPTARMFACVLDAVPAQIFDNQAALRSLLSTQLARQLDLAIDEHVVAAVEGGSPPHSSTGSDLVQKIRNAVSKARDYGSNPTVIALTPSDAASLDLSADAGGYIFSPDRTGSGVPIWSLAVRETPSIAHPTLIDTARWGVLFVGGGSVLIDPYGANMKRNLVSARVEVEGVAHRRDPLGVYVIN